MARDWTEQEIAALVDGSLESEQDVETVQGVVDQDPEARAYAAQLRDSNALLREAFEIPAEEPTPAAIEAAIFGEPGKVEMLRPRRAARAWLPSAIAASVALAIGLGLGGYLAPQPPSVIAALGDAPLEGPLHAALEGLPSGSISEAGVQPMLSFWDGSGRACREFEVIRELPEELEFGIACRTPEDRWHVEIIVAAPVTEPGPQGFSLASGPGGSALDAMLDALGAGPALTPDAEADLLGAGWRRP